MHVNQEKLTGNNLKSNQLKNNGASTIIELDSTIATNILLDSYYLNENVRIVHLTKNRLRLKIKQLHEDYNLSEFLLKNLSLNQGITNVRTNLWCESLIVEFDSQFISLNNLIEEILKLLELSNKVDLSDTTTPKQNLKTGFFFQLNNILKKLLPPWLQLSFGTIAFLSNFLDLPLLIPKILVSISIIPLGQRSLETLICDHKLSVDGLDFSASLLMALNNKLTEASFMTLLISLGEFIREATARKSSKLTTDLLNLSGSFAWLVKGKKKVGIACHEVKPNDIVVVYSGDKVPVDGIVISGEATLDQSKLTGESTLIDVTKDSPVYDSSVCVEGKIYIKCTSSGQNTKAGQIVDLLKNQPIYETRIQNWASVSADKMVVPIFLISSLTFILTKNIFRLMSMLIFDFSTGIRIAAPTAILSSMYNLGKSGILVKSGGSLEKLANVDAIVFDKTGTLTVGEPRVTKVYPVSDMPIDEIMSFAAAAELRHNHPASRAIVKHTQNLGIHIPDRSQSIFKTGRGVVASIDNTEIIVGSKRLMFEENIDITIAQTQEEFIDKLGESIAFIAVNKKLVGLISYIDIVRPEAYKTLKSLKRLGIKRLIMATGDGEFAANTIAKKVGITEVLYKCFPEQKALLVKELKEAGFCTAVIGDGVNDSPALAYADVAISLHGATQAAQHVADIVLTDDNLSRLPQAIESSRQSIAIVKQNISMVALPNSIGFILAAFGKIDPVGATVLNNGSAILAAVNSLRPLAFTAWSKVEDNSPNSKLT